MNIKIDPIYSKYLDTLEILPEDQLKKKFKDFYKTNSDKDFNDIFNSLQKLAVKYAYDKVKRCGINNSCFNNIEFMDLIQEGCLKLTEYIRKKTYDPDRDISPSTYFWLVLDSKVGGFVFSHSFPVKVTGTTFNKIRKNEEIRKEYENAKQKKRILKKYNITEEELTDYIRPTASSLYDNYEDEDGNTVYKIDKIANRKDTMDSVIGADIFYNYLQQILPKELYDILIYRYIEEYSVNEICDMLKESRKEVGIKIKQIKSIMDEHKDNLENIINQI